MSITLCIYVGTCNAAMRFYTFTQAPEHVAHRAKLTKLHDLCMAVSVSEVVAFQHDPTTPNLGGWGHTPINHMMLCSVEKISNSCLLASATEASNTWTWFRIQVICLRP